MFIHKLILLNGVLIAVEVFLIIYIKLLPFCMPSRRFQNKLSQVSWQLIPPLHIVDNFRHKYFDRMLTLSCIVGIKTTENIVLYKEPFINKQLCLNVNFPYKCLIEVIKLWASNKIIYIVALIRREMREQAYNMW